MQETDRSSLSGLDSGAAIRCIMRGWFLQKHHYLTTWGREHGAFNPLCIHLACAGHGVMMSTHYLAAGAVWEGVRGPGVGCPRPALMHLQEVLPRAPLAVTQTEVKDVMVKRRTGASARFHHSTRLDLRCFAARTSKPCLINVKYNVIPSVVPPLCQVHHHKPGRYGDMFIAIIYMFGNTNMFTAANVFLVIEVKDLCRWLAAQATGDPAELCPLTFKKHQEANLAAWI